MKKILLVFLLIGLVLFRISNLGGKKEIKVGDKIVRVEIAETKQEREKGLSDRKSLCSDCGLLFVFDASTTCRSASTLSECRRVDHPGIHPFWMRRMYFDIDIL